MSYAGSELTVHIHVYHDCYVGHRIISGIRHYHNSNRNLPNTPGQSTRLARAHMSSGVLEHLHVFALTSSWTHQSAAAAAYTGVEQEAQDDDDL